MKSYSMDYSDSLQSVHTYVTAHKQQNNAGRDNNKTSSWPPKEAKPFEKNKLLGTNILLYGWLHNTCRQ